MDFGSIIGVCVETERSSVLRINELQPLKEKSDLPALTQESNEISDEDWATAQNRLAAIRPLLNRSSLTQKEVEDQANKANIHPTTLYRWLKRYNAYESIAALIPQRRGWREGKSRLPAEVEAIIDQVLHDFYLTLERPNATKIVTEVQRVCAERNITAPSHATIRNRIAKIPEKKRLSAQGFKEKARNQFVPASGTFPNADYPLAVVQIDHTPADIILVDDVHQNPLTDLG